MRHCPQEANIELQAAYNELHAANYKLHAANYKLHAANYKLQAADRAQATWQQQQYEQLKAIRIDLQMNAVGPASLLVGN